MIKMLFKPFMAAIWILEDNTKTFVLFHANHSIVRTRSLLTIGPLPQPRAVQACSLRMCRLQGASPSTVKILWEELEFKTRIPSNQRP